MSTASKDNGVFGDGSSGGRQLAVVTGASAGIGYELARVCALNGGKKDGPGECRITGGRERIGVQPPLR
ncbi:MAG: hypothetical protein WCC96_10170 [Rhodomicrobium sp.]